MGPGGDTSTSAGSDAPRRREGWTLAVFAGAARPFPGLRGSPDSVPVKKKKNVPSHGAALGGAEVSSAAAPEPVPAPGPDLRRAALAHLAVCGFLSPGAGRLWAHASPA